MTEFVIVRLKGALHKDWMQTRPCLRKAIETGELVMPSLPDVVFDICSVWPLVTSYLKSSGKRDSKDSLVKQGIDGYLYHDVLSRMRFRLFHFILEICKSINFVRSSAS